MKLFIEYAGQHFFSAVDSPTPVGALTFNQSNRLPVEIIFTDGTAALAMDDWVVSIAIVGDPGKPTGTAGGPALAAYTSALDYDAPSKTFSGVLECNTAEMDTLIGSAAKKTSVFEVKAVNTATLERFALQLPCTILAAVIEEAPVGAAENPTAYTKAEADNRFVKRGGLPGETFLLVSPDGTKAVEVGCGDDGQMSVVQIDPYVAP